MKLLLSLDYELFFGARPGTVEKCLIEPINALLNSLKFRGLRLALFVDALYLARLQAEVRHYPALAGDFDAIRRQLDFLRKTGHDLQLHIHPHWEDCFYDGQAWRLDTGRYRLHDFTAAAMAGLVRKAKAILVEIAGDDIFAFRAGGWCLQPFSAIAQALGAAGIWLDSTVYAGGRSEDRLRWYDFPGTPAKSYWRFSDDPLREDPDGAFVEVPISSLRIGPVFFWKMIVAKKIGGREHVAFGDGSAMQADLKYYLRRLTAGSQSVVSIDGLKAGLLHQAFLQQPRKQHDDLFHVMGHPKSLTPYSLQKLAEFLQAQPWESITFQDLKGLKAGGKTHG